MGAMPVPMPQQQTQGDPGLGQVDPRQILAALAQGRTQGAGTTSIGSQIPMPSPIGTGIKPVGIAGPAQGEFATKGGHQRASMAALTQSVTSVANQAHNALEQHQNKVLGQKFQTLVGSQKGIQAADEMQKNAQTMLQQDPNSQEGQQMLQQAQDMKQHNTTILNQLLDPTTPEGKKNIKLFNKGFGFDDKNADTPERAAAIEAMKKSNPQMSQGAAGMMSQFPTGPGMSPQTQVQAEMVKAGVTPKAATGGQILGSQTKAAEAGEKAVLTQADQAIRAEKNLNDANHKTDELISHLPSLGLQAEKNDDGTYKRNADGTLKTRNLTMAELKDNPALYEKYQENQAKINLQVEQAKSGAVRASIAQAKQRQAAQTSSEAASPTAMLWAKKLSDPTSGVKITDVPSKERGAVLHALDNSGLKMQKPFSSEEMKRIDLSDNAIKNIDEADSILKRRPDLFGPGGWGKSKFEMALAGGDPDAVKFQTAMTLANLPLIGIHGVRGKWAAEDLSKLDSNLYLSPTAMSGVMSEIKRSASDFAKTAGRPDSMTGGEYKTIQGPNGPVKAKPVNGKWIDENGKPL